MWPWDLDKGKSGQNALYFCGTSEVGRSMTRVFVQSLFNEGCLLYVLQLMFYCAGMASQGCGCVEHVVPLLCLVKSRFLERFCTNDAGSISGPACATFRLPPFAWGLCGLGPLPFWCPLGVCIVPPQPQPSGLWHRPAPGVDLGLHQLSQSTVLFCQIFLLGLSDFGAALFAVTLNASQIQPFTILRPFRRLMSGLHLHRILGLKVHMPCNMLPRQIGSLLTLILLNSALRS